jgi:hypothetical protein
MLRATSSFPGVKLYFISLFNFRLAMVKDHQMHIEYTAPGQFFGDLRNAHLGTAKRALTGRVEKRIAVQAYKTEAWLTFWLDCGP